MRYSFVGLLMILTTMFLSGCGADQGKMAELNDKGSTYYGRNGMQMGGMGSQMSNRIRYTPLTTQSAPVDTITSSNIETHDLSAPSMTNSKSVMPAKTTTAKVNTNGTPFMTVAQSNALFAKQMDSAAAGTAASAAPAAGNWQWPVEGKVIKNFGSSREGVTSEGITISAAEGDPIHAAQSGTVAYVGHNMKDYGNIAILRHADGTLTSYAHARSFTVAKGDKVDAGGVIGFVGHTGSAKQPQLHFAVRDGNHSVDPVTRLPHNLASN